ncbi:YraN family protein [Gaoshiqia sp. Z1-71]|uniref:YraN family protein n=1 Tax=Gaoshiqia hydrogeniformans TaxID=3290090 RepID=UPI003BF8A8A6
MNLQKEIGDRGEEIAREHLRSLGYVILETNWHFHHYEIDIIARDGDELVIIEVKSRTGASFEHPSEAVSNKKIRYLVEAAEAYIFKKNSRLDTRFDVISIIFYNQTFELEHFKDAFYPTA